MLKRSLCAAVGVSALILTLAGFASHADVSRRAEPANHLVQPASYFGGGETAQVERAQWLAHAIAGVDGIYLDSAGRAVVVCTSDKAVEKVVSTGLQARRVTFGEKRLVAVTEKISTMRRSGRVRTTVLSATSLQKDRVVMKVARQDRENADVRRLAAWPEVEVSVSRARPVHKSATNTVAPQV